MPDSPAVILTQLSLKAGMKRCKGKVRAVAKYETKHLYFRDTFKPKHYRQLNEDKKKSILDSHIFLKEMIDGKIKGGTVEGGNKHRDFIYKEYYISPTVSTEAVIFYCIINEKYERDVAIIDIPNAFIQTRVKNENKIAVIKIRGVLVDLILYIDSEFYGTLVTTEKKG